MNRLNFFNMHADKWDGYIEKEFVRRIQEQIIPLFEIKKADKILDIGTGTGILIPFLKKKAGKKGKIVALDFSKEMLEKAKTKYGPICEYVHANAEKTPLAPNSFDKVICFAAFPHFPNKLKVLKEIKRVLVKNGKLYIAHSDVREKINMHHSLIGGAIVRDHMPDDKKITALLKKAGFNNIEINEGRDYYLASAGE